uniref:E3 UFM1-protein ligase 1 n=1 Tax=Pygocentrus nattereri TaxID=42514 RepID=A0AAR2JJQ0_PYGNA
MADWEEIRRLAADFQRAQFADSAQLSERNCIEIVAKLVLEKKLDVVHTLDGKEYITPPQISREIKDELYTHGGRINIVELQKIINVDLVHIEKQANDVSKQDRGTRLILGQLLDEKYLDQLAEEVNDKLQEVGQVNIAELCKTYDLPGEFLTEELCGRVGRVIDGQVDEFKRGVIFTQAFISRHTARIRGLFSALTRPTPVSTLISLYGFQENLLYSVLEELVNTGRLKGAVVGGRQDKAVYIPEIYSKTQNAWIDSFLKQNGYLEFEALSRLGIPDPVSYIKKRFKSSKLLFLKAACVGPEIIAQLEASVEEAVSSHTWVDLQPVLPSCLSEEDSELLIGQVLRTLGAQSTARILGSAAVSEKFVSDCMALFDDIMRLKAQKEVKNNPVFLIAEEDLRASALLENSTSSKKDKREERRKKSSEGSGSVRGGGGGNAREIRIRKTKKKNRKDEESDEDADTTHSKPHTLHTLLNCNKQTCMMFTCRPLTRKYQEVVRSAFLSSSSSGSGGNRKQNVKDVQEEINNLYNNVRLFEKGTKLFSDDTQLLLMKHLLRTICTDLTNILINLLSADLMMATENPSSITAESIEDFVSSLEAAAEECGLLLKKGDKKKERQALLLHKQALLEQLSEAEDPALVLHLTSVLLFQNVTHCVLHAPGRCVPNIISALQPKLPEDQYKLLLQFQGLVVKRLVQSHSQGKKADRAEPRVEPGAEPGGASPDELESVQKELSSLSRSIKELVLNPRRTSTTEE